MNRVKKRSRITAWIVSVAVAFAMMPLLPVTDEAKAAINPKEEYRIVIEGGDPTAEYEFVKHGDELQFKIVDDSGNIVNLEDWIFYAYGKDGEAFPIGEDGQFTAPDVDTYVYVSAYSRDVDEEGYPIAYTDNDVMVYVGEIDPEWFVYFLTHDGTAEELEYYDYLYMDIGGVERVELNMFPTFGEPPMDLQWIISDENVATIETYDNGWLLKATGIGEVAAMAYNEEKDFFEVYIIYVGCRRYNNGKNKSNSWMLYPGMNRRAEFTNFYGDETSAVIPATVNVTGKDAEGLYFRDSYIGKYTVRSIKAHAFDSKNMTAVTVPRSVTSIGEKAMGYYEYPGEPGNWQPVKDFTIKGYGMDCEAYRYAYQNGFNYVNLDPPSKVSADLYGYNDFKITWNKVAGISGYYVRYMKAGGSWSKAVDVKNAASYKKANLASGAKYCFKVTPYVKDEDSGKIYEGTSRTSSYVYTLKKIGTPKVSKASSKKVKVKWSNISGESGYQISKSTKKSGTNVVSTYKTTSGKSRTISAKKGKKYYYKVRAYKVVGGKKIYGPWSSVKAYTLK